MTKAKGDSMPLGSNPPSDVTIGELWRTLTTMSGQIEHQAAKVEDIPARIANDLGTRYDERLTAVESRTTVSLHHLDVRVQELEAWKQVEVGPHLPVIQERVALLQRLVYGAVGSTLLAVLVAILSSVTHH